MRQMPTGYTSKLSCVDHPLQLCVLTRHVFDQIPDRLLYLLRPIGYEEYCIIEIEKERVRDAIEQLVLLDDRDLCVIDRCMRNSLTIAYQHVSVGKSGLTEYEIRVRGHEWLKIQFHL